MRFRTISIVVVLVLAFSSVLHADSDNALGGKRPVKVGPAADISASAITRQVLHGDIRQLRPSAKALTFEIDPAECAVYPAPEEYEYLRVGDLKPSGRPGEPQLPMKTFVVELPREEQVYGVELAAGKFSEVEGEVNIAPMPQPGEWSADRTDSGVYVQDQAINGLKTPFPGRWVNYETGADNEHQYVYVRIFPLQYTPNRKKAIILTEATVNIYYGSVPSADEQLRDAGASLALAPITTSAQAIIICPSSLVNQANDLATFHSSEGMSSAVVTTEQISASYSAAIDPPISGYSNGSLTGWRNIKRYNYPLAKQIIAFLADQSNRRTGLAYVTLLGDGLLVPPSYYYSANGGSYDDWIPTDFFYASPDYDSQHLDFVANYKVGRLPVSNATEASALVSKLKNWSTYVQWSWFQKAYVSGGIPHAAHHYCAELNATAAVNADFFSGMNLSKCFHSDGAFTKTCLEPSLSTAPVGLTYFIAHGSVGGIALDDGGLTASNLMGYPSNLNTPVVLSVACDCGAYDLDLAGSSSGNSFGEAVLKSQAGGIAYIGGSRLNVGDAIYHYDQGNVVMGKQTYIIGLLHYVLGAYHGGASLLGDISTAALTTYVSNNDMLSDPVNWETVFRHVLLGDPALRIPAQQKVTENSTPACTADNPSVPGAIPIYKPGPVTITASTNSPSVQWKWVNVDADDTLDPDWERIGPPFSSQATSLTPALYLVRTAGEAASQPKTYTKENWLFYKIEAAGSPKMHVSAIGMTVKASGFYKYATATVSLVSGSNGPVAGATVTGDWTGLTMNSVSAVTDTKGQASFRSNAVLKTAIGKFTFCVSNAVLTGWIYDPGATPPPCKSAP